MFVLWPGILAGVPCSEKGKWDWGLEAGGWGLEAGIVPVVSINPQQQFQKKHHPISLKGG